MDNLYANIPRDLTRVKSKLFLNLTKRQILCFGAAAGAGLPLFFLIRGTGNMPLAAMTMILVMLPFFFFAMYEKNGQHLEVILKHFIRARVKRKRKRIYQTNNVYGAAVRAAKTREEVNRIVARSQNKKAGKDHSSGKLKREGKKRD